MRTKRIKRKTGNARNVKARLDEQDAVMEVIIDGVNEWSKGVNQRLAVIEEKLGIDSAEVIKDAPDNNPEQDQEGGEA
jgi:hypothetical protein